MSDEIPKYEDSVPVYEETEAIEDSTQEKLQSIRSKKGYYGGEKDLGDITKEYASGGLQKGLEFGADVLSAAGTALDYPIAPARSALALENPITPLIKGPSAAPTPGQLAEKIPGVKGKEIPLGIKTLEEPEFTKEYTEEDILKLQDARKLKDVEIPLSEALGLPLDLVLGGGAFKVLGKGAKVLAKGLETTGKKVIPEVMQQAYAKGKEGIKLDKEFLEKTSREAQAVAEKAAAPIIEQQATQRAINVKNIADLENQINLERQQLQKAIDASDNVALKSHEAKVEELKKQIFSLEKEYSGKLELQKEANDKRILNLKDQIDLENKKIDEAVKANKEQAQVIHRNKIKQLQSEIFDLKEDTAKVIKEQKKQLAKDNARNIENIENQLQSAKDEFDEVIELEKQKQIATNEKQYKKLEKDKLNLADRIQNRLLEVKNVLKNQYDEIDKKISDTNFTLDTRQIVSDFEQGLAEIGITDPKAVESITKKLKLNYGDDSIQAFNNLKKSLSDLFGHSDPRIGRLAKMGYKNLRETQLSELTKVLPDEAKRLSDTNKRWSKMYDLEDVLSPIEKETLDVSKTLKALKAEEGVSAEELARQRQLRQILPEFDPEQAEKIIKEMEKVGKKTAKIQSFKPQVDKPIPENILELEAKLKQSKELAKDAELPEYRDERLYAKESELEQLKAAGPQIPPAPVSEQLPLLEEELKKLLRFKIPESTSYEAYKKARELEALKAQAPKKSPLPTSPEVERLESLMREYKGQGVDNIPGLETFDLTSKVSIEQQLSKMIDDMAFNRIPSTARQKKFDDFFQFIEKNKGKDVAESLKQSMESIAKDKSLAIAAQRAADPEVEIGAIKNLTKMIIGGGVGLAQKTGQVSQKVPSGLSTKQQVLINGARALANSSKEEVEQLTDSLSKMGSAGQAYAKMLKDSINKGETSKNAAIHSLMQQPEFRKLYHQIKGISDETP